MGCVTVDVIFVNMLKCSEIGLTAKNIKQATSVKNINIL